MDAGEDKLSKLAVLGKYCGYLASCSFFTLGALFFGGGYSFEELPEGRMFHIIITLVWLCSFCCAFGFVISALCLALDIAPKTARKGLIASIIPVLIFTGFLIFTVLNIDN